MGCEDIGMNDKVFVKKFTCSIVAIPQPNEKLADWRNLLIIALVLLVVALWFR
jgi:hypothetical protein